jgi:hypothetical protein
MTKPGDRTTYHRVEDSAWENVVRRQIASISAFGQITRDGIALVGGSAERTGRIRAAHEVFLWLERVFADAPPLAVPRRQGR